MRENCNGNLQLGMHGNGVVRLEQLSIGCNLRMCQPAGAGQVVQCRHAGLHPAKTGMQPCTSVWGKPKLMPASVYLPNPA